MTQHNLPPGVLGLAINSQRQFLITQRNQPEDPDVHEKWQVPGGGLEFGEQPETTLIREMQEELNVTPTVLYPYPICRTSVFYRPENSVSVPLMCFIVTIGSQIPRIGDPETLDFTWVSKDELYRLNSLPLTTDFIDEAMKMCNQYSLWPA